MIKTSNNLQRRSYSPALLIFVMLLLVFGHFNRLEASGPALPQIKTGIVTGRLVVKGGGTMAKGQVMFYSGGDKDPQPDITHYMRVPNLVVDIGDDGNFSAVIPAGKFYFRAIKRNSGKLGGIPERSDYYFRYQEPGSSKVRQFSIKEGELLDLGILEAQVWQSKLKPLSSSTIITGTIREEDGHPVENGMVFAFNSPQMQGSKPLFLSLPTGPDGKYTLHVAPGGPYYLLARDVTGGGQVAEGGIIGQYGLPEPIGITLQESGIEADKDIIVIRMQRRGPASDSGTPSDRQPIPFSNPEWVPRNIPAAGANRPPAE